MTGMPKQRRKENQPLPKRWQYHNGAYYFRVPPGMEDFWDGKKRFRLGKTLAEAYLTWATRVGSVVKPKTMGALFDRYLAEVVPTKAPSTQRDNRASIHRLRPVFASAPIAGVKPRHAYEYYDRNKSAPIRAKHDVQVLRHALSMAVRWGLIDTNPLLGQLELPVAQGRDRYVEDWEVVEALKLPALRRKGSVSMLQAYIKLKLLTGLRRTDLLLLTTANARDDGLHVRPSKTAHTTRTSGLYPWNDDLRAAWDEALAARPVDIGPYVFCNRRGEPYFDAAKGSANGFDSIWQRFMKRLLEETAVRERFAERDLRAKCGTDAASLAEARQLLQHAADSTTQRWYRRKPTVIQPAKRKW